MSQIKIKHFGPIKEGFLENNGWLDIRKVTLFIGNQGSGKSTVAKLISCFKWIEKVLTRGDYESNWFIQRDRFRKDYCKAIQQLENTIKLILNNHNLDEFKYKKAFACNKNHPRFAIISNERNKRFFKEYGFRIDLQAKIIIK